MALASPRDGIRPAILLALGCCVVTIGMAAAAEERELGRHEALRAMVPGDFQCGEQAEVTVRAPDPSPFAGDRIALQKLLGGLRIMLGFECPDLQMLVLIGEAAGNEVYRGTASAHEGWVLADLHMPAAADPQIGVPDSAIDDQDELKRVPGDGGTDPEKSDRNQAVPKPVAAEAIVQASLTGMDKPLGAGALSGPEPQPKDIDATSIERRVALVIGNGAYGPDIGRLVNPMNDATDMAGALEAVGFDVTLQVDVDRDQMLRAVIEFGRSLRDGGVGLFYYAGHAVQLDGSNYMIPLGAKLEAEDYVPLETVDINQVLGRMGGANNRLNIVVLDACRNNPFRSISRSVSRGLAQTLAPTGTYIAYSAAPGQVALDGAGRNSPYTSGLVEVLTQPGLQLEEVFKAVRAQVLTSTESKQTPWTSSSITGDFYFRPPEPEEPKSVATASTATPDDVVVWGAIADSQRPEDFEMFLATYPDSALVPFVRQRLSRLQPTTNPGTEPEPPVSHTSR